MSDIDIIFDKYKPALERVLRNVSNDLEEILLDFSSERKIRYKKAFEKRIKSLDSVRIKLARKGEQDIFKINDLVGVRILAINKSDVNSIRRLLLEKWCDREISVNDYIETPKATGYRALHLNFNATVKLKNEDVTVPVEIQIKTLAQDLWSVLAHDDIYKQDNEVPDIISQFSSTLGALLDVADNQGEHIREFMAKKVVFSKDLSFDLTDEVDKEILAKIIEDCFGYSISEIEYRGIMSSLEMANIDTVDNFKKLIACDEVKNEVIAIFVDLSLPAPTPVELIVSSSTVYYGFMAEGVVDYDLLRDHIKERYEITDCECEDCGKNLTEDELTCTEDVESMNCVCSDCLEGYGECSYCGVMTREEGICSNCWDHYMSKD